MAQKIIVLKRLEALPGGSAEMPPGGGVLGCMPYLSRLPCQFFFLSLAFTPPIEFDLERRAKFSEFVVESHPARAKLWVISLPQETLLNINPYRERAQRIPASMESLRFLSTSRTTFTWD